MVYSTTRHPSIHPTIYPSNPTRLWIVAAAVEQLLPSQEQPMDKGNKRHLLQVVHASRAHQLTHIPAAAAAVAKTSKITLLSCGLHYYCCIGFVIIWFFFLICSAINSHHCQLDLLLLINPPPPHPKKNACLRASIFSQPLVPNYVQELLDIAVIESASSNPIIRRLIQVVQGKTKEGEPVNTSTTSSRTALLRM